MTDARCPILPISELSRFPSFADWRGFLNSAIQEEELRDLREHGRTGCPLGSVTFVQRLEQSAGRVLRPRNPGRPHKLLKRP